MTILPKIVRRDASGSTRAGHWGGLAILVPIFIRTSPCPAVRVCAISSVLSTIQLLWQVPQGLPWPTMCKEVAKIFI